MGCLAWACGDGILCFLPLWVGVVAWGTAVNMHVCVHALR